MDHDSDLDLLPPGTRLHELVIRAPIARGGSGVVYAADHQILNETYAVKEYLPADLAPRTEGYRVAPLSGKQLVYDKLREKFLETDRKSNAP